jgi:hypothetical protein
MAPIRRELVDRQLLVEARSGGLPTTIKSGQPRAAWATAKLSSKI